MVFILRNEKTGETLVLGENIDYTLGRSRVNKILLKDKETRNKHAKIVIKHGIATIKVVSPKGPVFINDYEHKIYNETVLESGDVIIFGRKTCCYRFHNPNYQVFLDDSITSGEKNDLCIALKELKVIVLNNYSDECTHFVLPTLTLEKFKNAEILEHFLNKKDIVTAKFWIDMLKNIGEAADNLNIPNIYRYMPILEQPLIEKGVEVVRRRNRTKNLFKNMQVVFFDENLERDLKHIIVKCGGFTFVHDMKALVSPFSLRDQNNTVLVVSTCREEEPIVKRHCINTLRDAHKRVYELGMDDIYIAVLKGSLKLIESISTTNERSE